MRKKIIHKKHKKAKPNKKRNLQDNGRIITILKGIEKSPVRLGRIATLISISHRRLCNMLESGKQTLTANSIVSTLEIERLIKLFAVNYTSSVVPEGINKVKLKQQKSEKRKKAKKRRWISIISTPMEIDRRKH